MWSVKLFPEIFQHDREDILSRQGVTLSKSLKTCSWFFHNLFMELNTLTSNGWGLSVIFDQTQTQIMSCFLHSSLKGPASHLVCTSSCQLLVQASNFRLFCEISTLQLFASLPKIQFKFLPVQPSFTKLLIHFFPSSQLCQLYVHLHVLVGDLKPQKHVPMNVLYRSIQVVIKWDGRDVFILHLTGSLSKAEFKLSADPTHKYHAL